MSRSTLPLILSSALAASVVSFALFLLALRGVRAAEGEDPRVAQEIAALGQRVDALAASSRAPDPSADGLRAALAALDSLSERVGRIESAARRSPAAEPAPERPAEPEPQPDAAADRAPRPAGLGKQEFAELLGRVLADSDGTQVSPEDQQRFWEAARTTGLVDELLSELRAAIDERPADVALRLELADAYVAKLLTVPAGPERGVWGMRAEEQWHEAQRIDPGSWEAQFKLAESLSYYPSFLNRTGDAIAGLERARELQEGRAPEARHAQTYALLARMYQQDGRPELALDALRAGLARHPGDAQLERALADLERR